MLSAMWLTGLLKHRTARALGIAGGVALTVALLASIGAFVASSAEVMTERAVANVPVDWQVQLAPGTDPQTVLALLDDTHLVESVGYANTDGFSASTRGTVQTTGPGKVLGISATYHQNFPAELRPLLGTRDGVLVAQQTAANLHVGLGDSLSINRVGLPPVVVTVDGVVDLPYADSLFQAVGVPNGIAPQAPPDNVLLLPEAQWHQIFDAQQTARPDSIRTQLHVRLPRSALPHDPGSAYSFVQQRSNNLEARVAGSAIVGDNLLARLDGVRSDALYAQVMFLFLGLPGAVLAALLTVGIAASGADRRRREQAILRMRGASTGQVLRLATIEALAFGLAGAVFGLALAAVMGAIVAPAGVPLSPTLWLWSGGAALAGLVLALGAGVLPAWLHARYSTVVAARVAVGRPVQPLWQRGYVDVVILLVAAIAFWQAAATGYHLVLAPEGVAQTSVSYQAFLGPLGLWLGVGLLAVRLCQAGLARGRRLLAEAVRPIAGGLSGVSAAALGRQRVLVTRGLVLVALAFSFATSTAAFNATYNAQSQVDAALTNGADVSATAPTAWASGPEVAALAQLPGVVAVQPLQHRLAYVGNDLQDLFGVDPTRIGEATTLANAYFANGDAHASLAALAAQPDALLVSGETASDYQLHPGERVNLRLQNGQDHQYHLVPFTFVGVVREFPTAPKDSFLVARSDYLAQQTGIDAAETVLLRTDGSPLDVAARVRAVVAAVPGARVNDVGSTHATISSSLTAVDLRGLTQLELAFAVLLVAGAAGLVLALGLAERRRTFAILAALGASGRQLGGLLWSEGLLILLGGGVLGVALGLGVAQMLVTLLTGVFDPAPEGLVIPWAYLGLLGAAAAAATSLAVMGAASAARRPVVEVLRDL
jgi:putative ABC transport system permease protein